MVIAIREGSDIPIYQQMIAAALGGIAVYARINGYGVESEAEIWSYWILYFSYLLDLRSKRSIWHRFGRGLSMGTTWLAAVLTIGYSREKTYHWWIMIGICVHILGVLVLCVWADRKLHKVEKIYEAKRELVGYEEDDANDCFLNQKNTGSIQIEAAGKTYDLSGVDDAQTKAVLLSCPLDNMLSCPLDNIVAISQRM